MAITSLNPAKIIEKKVPAKQVPDFLGAVRNLLDKKTPANLDGIPKRYSTISLHTPRQALQYLQILDSLANKPEVTAQQIYSLLTIGSNDNLRMVIQAKYKENNLALISQHGRLLQSLVKKLLTNYTVENLNHFINILQLPLPSHGKESMPWMQILLQEGKDTYLRIMFNDLISLSKLAGIETSALFNVIVQGNPSFLAKLLSSPATTGNNLYLESISKFFKELLNNNQFDNKQITDFFNTSLQQILNEIKNVKKINITQQTTLQRIQALAQKSELITHTSEAAFFTLTQNMLAILQSPERVMSLDKMLELMNPVLMQFKDQNFYPKVLISFFKGALQQNLVEMAASKKVTSVHQTTFTQLQNLVQNTNFAEHIEEGDYAAIIKEVIKCLNSRNTSKAQDSLLNETKPFLEFLYQMLGDEKFNNWTNNALTRKEYFLLAPLKFYSPATSYASSTKDTSVKTLKSPLSSKLIEEEQENQTTALLDKINVFLPKLQELIKNIQNANHNLITLREIEKNPDNKEIIPNISMISKEIASVKEFLEVMPEDIKNQSNLVFKEFQKQIANFKNAYAPIKNIREFFAKIANHLPELMSFATNLQSSQQFNSEASIKYFEIISDITGQIAALEKTSYILTPEQKHTINAFKQVTSELQKSYCDSLPMQIHKIEKKLDNILDDLQDSSVNTSIESTSTLFKELGNFLTTTTFISAQNSLNAQSEIKNEIHVITEYIKEIGNRFFTEILKPLSSLSPLQKTNCILAALENNLLTPTTNKLLERNLQTNQLDLQAIIDATPKFHQSGINAISKSIFTTLLSYTHYEKHLPQEVVHPNFVQHNTSLPTLDKSIQEESIQENKSSYTVFNF